MEERIDPKIGVVIVAGGGGRRVGGSIPKQFQFLGSLPILAYAINTFAKTYPNASLVVVLAEDRVDYWKNLSARFDVAKHRVAVGGSERFHSVRAGVEMLGGDFDLIAVHDGARPLVTSDMIERCVACAVSNGSAIPVVEVSDSLRAISGLSDVDGVSLSTSKIVDRSLVRAVQTPQVFDSVMLRRAYREPYSEIFTDEASVVESLGERVWLCDGERRNLKITTREDISLARLILEQDMVEDGE